jgi:hypothetical protein
MIPRRKAAEKEMGDDALASSTMPCVWESSLVWPMLDRSNYPEWTMLMQCNLEALEIWHGIDPGTNVKQSQDRQAMSTLLRSVLKEMWPSLGGRKTVKEVWEAVR